VTEIYNQANTYFWNKDYINAIKNFKIIIDNYPSSSYTVQALYSLGSAYYELQDYQNAIIAYKQLAEEYPNHNLADDALFRLGEAYIKVADYQNANNVFLKLIKDYPESLLIEQAKYKVDSLPFSEKPKEVSKRVQPKSIQAKQEAEVSAAPVEKKEKVKKREVIKKKGEKKYVVKPGDTLTSIAELFYNDFNKYTVIANYNKITNPANIYPGMTLNIPVEEEEVREVEKEEEIEKEEEQVESKYAPEIKSLKEEKLVTDEMAYKMMLNKQAENYEEVIKVERKKLSEARENIKRLNEIITKLNLDIDTYKNQLNELLQLRNDNNELLKKTKEYEKMLGDMAQEKLAIESKYKAEITKLNMNIEQLNNELKTARDLSKEKMLEKSLEEKEKELTVIKFQIEKKESEIKKLEERIKELENKLKIALDTSEVENLKKEIITLKKDNVEIKGENIRLNETIKSKNLEIERLNKELDDMKKDTTVALLKAEIEQKNARIEVLERTINEYKLATTKSEELTKLKQLEAEKKFEIIQKQLDELTAKLKETEKSLLEQKNLSLIDKEKKEKEIKEEKEKLIKTIEKESAEKAKIKEELKKKEEQLQTVTETVAKVKEKVDKKKESIEYVKKGLEYKQANKFEEAEKAYLKAIELDTTNADAYNNLGYLYSEKGIKLQEAIKYIERALELNPGQKGYYLDSIGWIYYKLGDYNKAMTNIKSALQLIPDSDKNALAQIHFHLGNVYMKIGDNDKAFFEFFEVMKLVPDTKLAFEAKKILDTL